MTCWQDHEAVELRVASLSGRTWSVSVTLRTTGGERVAWVVELAGMPRGVVVLI